MGLVLGHGAIMWSFLIRNLDPGKHGRIGIGILKGCGRLVWEIRCLWL